MTYRQISNLPENDNGSRITNPAERQLVTSRLNVKQPPQIPERLEVIVQAILFFQTDTVKYLFHLDNCRMNYIRYHIERICLHCYL